MSEDERRPNFIGFGPPEPEEPGVGGKVLDGFKAMGRFPQVGGRSVKRSATSDVSSDSSDNCADDESHGYLSPDGVCRQAE